MQSSLAGQGSSSVWNQPFPIWTAMIHPHWVAASIHAMRDLKTLDAILYDADASSKRPSNQTLAEGFLKPIASPASLAKAVSSPTNSAVVEPLNSERVKTEFLDGVNFNIGQATTPSRLRKKQQASCKRERKEPVRSSPPPSKKRKVSREENSTTRIEESLAQIEASMQILAAKMQTIANAQQALIYWMNHTMNRLDSNRDA